MSEPANVTARVEVLERWSPTLFLVAGAILVVYAAFHGMEAFLDMDYAMVRDGIIRPVGYILGFVAVLGLYPKLAGRSPKLASLGAILTALAVVGWFVSGFLGPTRGLAMHLGVETPGWINAFGILIALGFLVGLPAFGIASLRAKVYPKTVGLLLLAPILVMVANFVIVGGGFTSPFWRFVVSSGDALIILTLGIALRTGRMPTGRAERQPTEM